MSDSNNFEDLLAKIEAVGEEQTALAKSMGASADDKEDDTDQTVAAAAEDADDNDDGDEANTDAPMAKSMSVDGKEYEVVDADEILKSLGSIDARLGAHETVLAKALESVLGTVQTQASMIKSLTDKVEKLSGSAAPRKSVLAVTERRSVSDPAPSKEPAVTVGDVMAKSMAAMNAGKISGYDVARLENYIQSGIAPPADLIAKIN